uniref:Ig-like domain-containing protein n=1 Tax=Echeneis naucrates TaxID=173247 RepID=A0A665VKD7_ECHNA
QLLVLALVPLLLLLLLVCSCALEITSQIKYYYVAGDSSVTLQCEFVLASDNLAHTEIEWIIVPPDRDKDEDVIIWYTGGIIYDNLYGPLKQRVHFTSPEPQDGIASITMTDLKHTDSGTYQCKVKKLPDIANKNLFLSVMKRPSKPECSVERQAVAGRDLRLRCRSSQGTPPLLLLLLLLFLLMFFLLLFHLLLLLLPLLLQLLVLLLELLLLLLHLLLQLPLLLLDLLLLLLL